MDSAHSSYQSATETTKIYYNKYVRNSRAIGVMWAIFVICLAVIELVVFVQPQWIGDSNSSPGTGYFGLFEHCVLKEDTSGKLECEGSLNNFESILNNSFKAATVLVGISVLCVLLCVLSLLLFFFVKAKKVFIFIGFILLCAAIFLTLGCLVYPAGWNDATVQMVCGNSEKYKRNNCEIRWALILAIIAIFDGIVLAILAFVLGSRQPSKRSRYLARNENIVSVARSEPYAESIGKPSMLINPKVAGNSGNEEFRDYSQYSTQVRSRKY